MSDSQPELLPSSADSDVSQSGDAPMAADGLSSPNTSAAELVLKGAEATTAVEPASINNSRSSVEFSDNDLDPSETQDEMTDDSDPLGGFRFRGEGRKTIASSKSNAKPPKGGTSTATRTAKSPRDGKESAPTTKEAAQTSASASKAKDKKGAPPKP